MPDREGVDATAPVAQGQQERDEGEEMTTATRRCPGPHDPPELIPSEKAFCRRHWFALPKPMRDDIWAAYRLGRGGPLHLRLLAEAARYVRGSNA